MGGGVCSWRSCESTRCICERSWLRRCTSAASSAPLQLEPQLMEEIDEHATDAAVVGRCCCSAVVGR